MLLVKKYFLLFLLLFSVTIIPQEKTDLVFELKGVQVTAITSDDDYLWVATNGSGIFRYSSSGKTWKQYSTSNQNLQMDFFHSIAANNEFVWAGSTDGLFILDRRRDNWTRRKFGLGGQLSNWIRSVVYDKDEDAVWIGRFKYLSKYELKTKRFIDYDLTVRNNEKSNSIKTLAVEGDSVLWIGTEAGLHKYNKTKKLNDNFVTLFYDNRLNYFNGDGEQISVSSLLPERNFLWIGLDEFLTTERPEFNLGGLYRFNRKNEWLRNDDKNGLPANGIYSMERTGNYIWISLYQFGQSTKESFGRGLALLDRKSNKIMRIQDDRIPQTIHAIYFDQVNLWLGTDNGLIKINFINDLAKWNNRVKK